MFGSRSSLSWGNAEPHPDEGAEAFLAELFLSLLGQLLVVVVEPDGGWFGSHADSI